MNNTENNKDAKNLIFLEREYSFNNFSDNIELNPQTQNCKYNSTKNGNNISNLKILK